MRFLQKVLFILLPPLFWAVFTFVAAFEGLWLQPVADTSEGFNTYVSKVMKRQFKGNGAVVLLNNGKIENSYFQSADVGANLGQDINADTVFPLASMSKLIAAVAIHKLVAEQAISLSDPVEKYISKWALPEGDFDGSQVTIEMLLSHTGGLNDGLGFGDYRVDEQLPSLVDSLIAPRASKGDTSIALGHSPGELFMYSGGGYLMLELLVEEVTGQSYESWVTNNVFLPLNMRDSGFYYLLDKQNNSGSFSVNGQPTEVFQYASSAATALNASVNDLVSLTNHIVYNRVLSQALQKPLAKVFGAYIWGAGAMLYAPLGEDDFIFGHDGSNDPALNTSVRINPQNGQVFIALISGDQTLASELGYEWTLWQSGKPDFVFTDRAINSAIQPFLIGILSWFFSLLVWNIVRRVRLFRSDKAVSGF